MRVLKTVIKDLTIVNVTLVLPLDPKGPHFLIFPFDPKGPNFLIVPFELSTPICKYWSRVP